MLVSVPGPPEPKPYLLKTDKGRMHFSETSGQVFVKVEVKVKVWEHSMVNLASVHDVRVAPSGTIEFSYDTKKCLLIWQTNA
jgi:hypothetical protein